jgi:hypothetical protein
MTSEWKTIEKTVLALTDAIKVAYGKPNGLTAEEAKRVEAAIQTCTTLLITARIAASNTAEAWRKSN